GLFRRARNHPQTLLLAASSCEPVSCNRPEMALFQKAPGRGARLRCCLDEAAQHFGDAPGLSDAAARRKGRFGVEDLADRADPGLGEMRLEAGEKTARLFRLVRVDLEPGIDKGADQPGP